MEKEILFTTSKWTILQSIAQCPDAPLGIAKKLNTSVANVSQQLRLLEAAGLVKKQRIANAGAGQPRALFSLSHEFAYISLASHGIAKKELVPLSKHQVFVSRCLLLNKPDVSDTLIKFSYSNETIFNEIESLYFLSADSSEIVLETISSKSVSKTFVVKFAGRQTKVTIKKVSSISDESELLFNSEVEKWK